MKKIIAISLVVIIFLFFTPASFASGSEADQSAKTLYELGLFKGIGTDVDENPIFDLDRAPSRYEAVIMLIRLLGKEREAESGNWDTTFTDVASWAAPYVGYACANGLTMGTGAAAFGGDDTVSATQYLTFILRALGYSSGTDFTWNKAWELSDKLGLTHGEYPASTKFTRGDAAIISYNCLSQEIKGSDTSLLVSLWKNGSITSESIITAGFVDLLPVSPNSKVTGYDKSLDVPDFGMYFGIEAKQQQEDIGGFYYGYSLEEINKISEESICMAQYGNLLVKSGYKFAYSFTSEDGYLVNRYINESILKSVFISKLIDKNAPYIAVVVKDDTVMSAQLNGIYPYYHDIPDFGRFMGIYAFDYGEFINNEYSYYKYLQYDIAAVESKPQNKTKEEYGDLLLNRGFTLSQDTTINESGNGAMIFINPEDSLEVDLIETEENGLKFLTVLIRAY